ncbi:MAG: butyrate kinase [Alloprevotella sp.]|nr:butyrate kinase [Alloprevotella sp.]
MKRILVVNPGSTSTKVAIFNDEEVAYYEDIHHEPSDLDKLKTYEDRYEYHYQAIVNALESAGVTMQFDLVMGRGGLMKPMEGGVYKVNDQMLADVPLSIYTHPCNLGSVLAKKLAVKAGCEAYTADSGNVDEMLPEIHFTGSPLLPHHPIWHCLNQRAIARRYAKEIGKRYEELNLVVCHLGGGISVALHRHGKAIDVNNALDGQGTYSPERAGTLPAGDLIRLCYSGKFTQEELLKRISGRAGLTAHLGTNDMREVVRRIEAGDEKARVVTEGMFMQIGKQIVAEAAILQGAPDAILLTGGLVHSPFIVEHIKKYIGWLAPVKAYPGQDEMQALAENGLLVLRGELEVKEYK